MLILLPLLLPSSSNTHACVYDPIIIEFYLQQQKRSGPSPDQQADAVLMYVYHFVSSLIEPRGRTVRVAETETWSKSWL